MSIGPVFGESIDAYGGVPAIRDAVSCLRRGGSCPPEEGGTPRFGPSGSVFIDSGFGKVDVFGNFPVDVVNAG
jgi:hypothetical protein